LTAPAPTRLKKRLRLQALLLLIAIPWAHVYAQPETTASLVARADSIKRSDYPAFKVLLKALAERQDLKPAERNLYNYLRGWEIGYDGEQAPALKLLNQVLLDSSDPNLKFRALATIVNVMTVGRDYQGAFENLNKMLEVLPSVIDETAKNQGLLTAALMHNSVGQYESGLQYAEKLLGGGTVLGSAECPAEQIKVEALFWLKRINPESAEIKRALDACTRLNDSVFGNLIRTYPARMYLDLRQPDAAITMLGENYEAVQKTGYARLRSEFDFLLAKAWSEKGNDAMTEQFARSAIEKAVKNEFSGPVVEATQLLYQLAKRRGNLNEALAYHEKFAKADKAHLDQISARQLGYEMVKQQAYADRLQIESLSQKNQLLSLEQSLSDKAVANARLSIALLLTFLALVAFFAARIYRSRQHFRALAEQDALTSVYARRRFLELAESMLENARKQGLEVCLLMIDLDQFKQINDVHGHTAGDAVLAATISAARALLSSETNMPGGILGRLGGEEFALLIPTSAKKASALAERLRGAIGATETRYMDITIRISASFGLVSSAQSGYALRQLLINGDQALYRAKRAGRNQVALWA